MKSLLWKSLLAPPLGFSLFSHGFQGTECCINLSHHGTEELFVTDTELVSGQETQDRDKQEDSALHGSVGTCLFSFEVFLQWPRNGHSEMHTDLCLDASVRECGISESRCANPACLCSPQTASPALSHGVTILHLNDCNPLLLRYSFFSCCCCLEISLFCLCSLQKVLLQKIQTHTEVERTTYEIIMNPCVPVTQLHNYQPMACLVSSAPANSHLHSPCPQIILKQSLD